MRKSRKLLAAGLLLLPLAVIGYGASSWAGDDDATRIHLTERNGYFEVKETLMNLEPGKYVFEVKNKAGKMVGFQIQDLETGEVLGMGPIETGKTREFEVNVTANGFRYRCPMNPTPWYEVSVGKM